MKYYSLIFCLLMSIGERSFANEIVKSARGVVIIILDDEKAYTNNWKNNAHAIVSSAMRLQGTQYKYGGSSPETGFDCSGLVNYVFKEVANVNLPRTSRAISNVGQSISRNALAPGDLVFFNTLKSPFSHVGIYIGGDRFIHAPRPGKAVRTENMNVRYWKTRFNGGQRLNQEVVSANR